MLMVMPSAVYCSADTVVSSCAHAAHVGPGIHADMLGITAGSHGM